MFTPAEIQGKQFKTGIGYDKKDVEQFLHDISTDYELVQSENISLRKKLKDQEESLSYYKSIEKTLQKALILAEKTAQDTKATAYREADAIEMEAKAKANFMLANSRRQIELLEHKTLNLMQQYDLFKISFDNLLHAQIELLNSKSFSVNTDDFLYNTPEAFGYEKPSDNTFTDGTHYSDHNPVDNDLLEENLSVPEEDNQIRFDFLSKEAKAESYQTEDGFEFFTMKDE